MKRSPFKPFSLVIFHKFFKNEKTTRKAFANFLKYLSRFFRWDFLSFSKFEPFNFFT